MARPNKRSALAILARGRLLEVAQGFELDVRTDDSKAELVDAIAQSKRASFERVLEVLKREELKEICRAHGLDDSGKLKQSIVDRILDRDEAPGLPGVFEEPAGDVQYPLAPEAAAPAAARDAVLRPPASQAVIPALVSEPTALSDESSAPSPAAAPLDPSALPLPGEIVVCRQRQYLVETAVPAATPGEMSRVEMVCLDDDNQGRSLTVLWELELGARKLAPAVRGLGDVARLDRPRHFAAYLHAIKWNCVTATNARLFQAPFRAGIQILQHQLAPLRKALELPRANLFIADDVGLGKTVEAGLVIQELLLRQRLDFIVIVAPASITLQWKAEMERRFGLQFEIYNREFVARRRRERGFGVNPWATHNRFIISYQTLRRPEYRDELLAVFRERDTLVQRRSKSLLVLDEAHTVAPATASKYAVDSNLTHVARELAPLFENRLFLSATPHNGHSNSFSALLEILDPQRFTRGVKVSGPESLEAVMVRRLKKDLRAMGTEHLPERRLVEIEIVHGDGVWRARTSTQAAASSEEIGTGSGVELELARLLAQYAAASRPKTGRGRLVFINLQKRLLSSVEAFFRTLTVHCQSVARSESAAAGRELDGQLELDEEVYGRDDDDESDEEVRVGTRALPECDDSAKRLLSRMQDLARRHRGEPDAKALALLAWIRRHQCAGVAVGGAAKGTKGTWSSRRLLVFTEYADTKRYLLQLLGQAVAGTHLAESRIASLHGGMSDEAREQVQLAFNGDPELHPLRVLVATDAAREGVNLQGQCADLIHYDIPWNPARLEQRNGRIDRTLQPSPEVRCHYFIQPQRSEDRVLATLVKKIERIHEELGSLSQVVMDRIERALDEGIDDETQARLERAAVERDRERVVAEELEASHQRRLQEEVDTCAQLMEESRREMEFDPVLLKDAIDVGCVLAGLPCATPVPSDAEPLWQFPEFPSSWARTLDSLRPPRGRDEDWGQWRRRPLLPVAYEPGKHLSVDRVHLHLQHPFVQRMLSRFLAQGYSRHDLGRVTVVRTKYTLAARVVAFGRLSLFGRGATRLHDRMITIVAPWLEGKGKTHLQPFVSEADREALIRFEDALREAPELDAISDVVRGKLTAAASDDFATLWTHVEQAAVKEEARARAALGERGTAEAEALRGILDRQRVTIERTLAVGSQLALELDEADVEQRRQFQQDQRHMQARLAALATEREREPAQIIAGYEVMARRLEPIGLVYLWPQNR